jgi:hypothetical protein
MVSERLGRKLYITTHEDQGNGTFSVNNLDSYIFVIVQIRAFDMMFAGREVGHTYLLRYKSVHLHDVCCVCAHAKVHTHTHCFLYSIKH